MKRGFFFSASQKIRRGFMSEPRKRKREGNVWVARLTDFKDDYKLRGDDPSDTTERAFWESADADRCVAEAKLALMREAIEEESPYCYALAGMGPQSRWPRRGSWGGPECPVRKKYYDGAREAAAKAEKLSDEALLGTWRDFVEGEFVPRRHSYRVEELKVE